jgi:hypothetical protein
MTQSNPGDPGNVEEAKLPRRDWILLPALSLLTMVFLAVSAVLLASWLFPSSEAGLKTCFAKADPSGQAPARPNTVCSERTVESKFVAEYRFNSCGHRAGMECGPKPPGTYRIVMIGSSMAMGLFVPRQMTFAALLPPELSRRTGRKIEIYNEATGGEFRGGPFPVRDSPLHFNQVLSADPDMILWIVTPTDIENMSFEDPAAPPPAPVQQAPAPQAPVHQAPAPGNPLAAAWNKLKLAIASGRVEDRLRFLWDQTTASVMLKHFLLETESQDQYVKSYLQNEDDAGFLKAQPDAKWQRLLGTFQKYAAQFEAQASAAGVPFVAVLVPNRAQAAMLSEGEWPAGYDPYKLDDEVRAVIVSHGGFYVDILPDYRTIPNPEQNYFPVDGHPDADGNRILSGFLAKELTGGAVPALRAAEHVALEQAK